MNKRVWYSIIIIVAVALSVYSLTQTTAHSDNTAFCNIQGRILNTNNNPLNLSQININCTLIRNNSINTTYTTTNGGTLFPALINNSYRCSMICTNISLDTVELNFYNTTHEIYNTTTLTTATKQFNFTLLTVTAPTIYNITGNTTATTGDTITLAINATDNINVSAANLSLNNGTIIAMLEPTDEHFAVNISPANNSIAAISYIITAYDRYLLNTTSANYTLTVTDNDPPTANAGQTITINQNQIAQFNASNSSDNIAITSYSWNFNLSNNTIATAANPTYNYTIPGTYNVSLTLKDAANNNATNYVTVIVSDDIKPFITGNSPANNSNNIARNTNIAINFSESIKSQTINNSIFIYEINKNNNNNDNQIAGELYYNSSTNATTFIPNIILKENQTYTVNITKNIQDNVSNNMSADYLFNFTTKLQDTDNDGIPDINDTDKDNDGIANNNDKLNGNASAIYTNIGSLSIAINGSANLAQQFNDIADVRVYNSSKELVEFQFNFTAATLDLTNISIYETNNATVGEIIVGGIDLSTTTTKKTIFLTNKSDLSGICIKDAELTSITQISTACTGTNETKVECNGVAQSGYTCSFNTTLSKYKITGLTHSGIRQMSYTQPIANIESSGGGGGGGGGGGSYTPPIDLTKKNNSKAGQCGTNLDCNDEQTCTNNICTPVFCPKGSIISHFCIQFECTENNDCKEKQGKICYANKCRECMTTEQCGKGFACQEYSCKELPKSITPKKEEIKQLTIKIILEQPSYYVGNTLRLQLQDENKNTVRQTQITILYPSGKQLQKTADEEGKISIKLEEQGFIKITAAKQNYKTTILKVEVLNLSFFGRFIEEADLTKVAASGLLVIILIGTLILAYYMIKPTGQTNQKTKK